MNLKMHQNSDGQSCSVLMCDHCNTKINSAKDGVAAYRSGFAVNSVRDVKFYHRRCDHEVRLASGEVSSWENLDVFLVYLVNGLNIDWEGVQERAAALASV